MKKIFLSIVIVLCGCFSFAQITLLHTFSDSNMQSMGGTCYGSSMPWFEFISEPVNCYLFYDRQNNSIKIYNSNFQIIKNTYLPSNLFANGEILEDMNLFGRHIINTDEKIEFLVTTYLPTDDPNLASGNMHYYIINEDGDIIYDCGNNPIYPESVHKIGNQLRAYAQEGGNSYQIYSLGGNYNPSTMVTYPQQGSFLNPYPNPSRNTISLPYTLQSGETSQLHVFNMNGQLLETFNIGSDFDKILLNVSGYPKGTYIYTYNGVSKKFVVQ